MTGIVRWSVAAAVGGLIGAAIWAGITYFTGYEVGWIAWGVGFLVGAAVRAGAGADVGAGPGIIAVVGAVAALLAGKYAAVHLLVSHEIGNGDLAVVTAESLQVGIADEIVEEWESQGKALNWPPGQNVQTAESAAHYPPDVWAEAQTRWNAFPPDEQTKKIDERKALIASMTGAFQEMATAEGFKASFSPIDLLFFGLAIFTAFKLGSGASSA